MKKGIFILLAISLATSVYILASSDTDSIYHKVQGFGIGLPQEKVYLHLDNTCILRGRYDLVQRIRHTKRQRNTDRLEQNPLRGTAHTGWIPRRKAATRNAEWNS